MWRYSFTTSAYTIEITGGSVRIIDRATNEVKQERKGYTYLYTGAAHPMETEFFALENGKHFYVYSLENLTLKHTVTLPRTYEAIDVCGFYSEDGNFLTIPAQRYVWDQKERGLGHYEYVLCKYSTVDYTLMEKTEIPNKGPYLWKSLKEWTAKTIKSDPLTE